MPAHDPTDDCVDDLDAVVAALYLRPLDEFVAARDAVVRQAMDDGDRLGAERVKRLPKPSVAAWVINRVAHEHAADVAALVRLGDELRTATADGDRGRLRALDQLRRERTEELVRTVRAAGQVGGRPVTAPVLTQLAQTLTAAVMDQDAAVVVQAGRLSRGLQHVGFGIVDEQGEDADLVPLRPAPVSEAGAQAGAQAGARAGAQVERLTAHRDEARDQLRAALAAVERRGGDVERVDRELERVDSELERLERELERLERELERLDRERERLAAEREATRRTLDDDRAAADEARSDLAAAEEGLADAVERPAALRRRRSAREGHV